MTKLSKYFTICYVLWNLENVWKTKKPVNQRNDDTLWSSFPYKIIMGGINYLSMVHPLCGRVKPAIDKSNATEYFIFCFPRRWFGYCTKKINVKGATAQGLPLTFIYFFVLFPPLPMGENYIPPEGLNAP